MANNPSLTTAVGPGQKNSPEDIQTLRHLLNKLVSNGHLGPAYALPEAGGWDSQLAAALQAVEDRYFFGEGDPDNKLENDDDLFQFLVSSAQNETNPVARLSNQTYLLAAAMVPGGIRRIKSKPKNKSQGGTAAGEIEVIDNIRTYLPAILKELTKQGINDTEMLMMALGTIRAETATFRPISEGVSAYNTTPVGTPDRHPFDKYDFRDKGKLGNNGYGQGDLYKGRGFVQITGRFNYEFYGKKIGVNLLDDPEKANEPEVAAAILAAYLSVNNLRIRRSLKSNNLLLARKAVNGGEHGIEQFREAFAAGRRCLSKTP